jgi:hypothetical protein
MSNARCEIFSTTNSGHAYFVTTVGGTSDRAYIKTRELADRQLEQFELKISAAPKSIKAIPQTAFGGSNQTSALLEVVADEWIEAGSQCRIIQA